MKILAIDPGFERLGIAILNKTKQSDSLEYSSCFKTSAKLPFSERLFLLGNEVSRIIHEYSPDVLAIETLLFNNNQKTVMKVSEARGAIIFTAKQSGIDVFEYTPLQIKIAVTGYGRSEKKQVISMVHRILHIEKKITYDDEYDAIAIALTHSASASTHALLRASLR